MGDRNHADQGLRIINAVVHKERETIQRESSVLFSKSLPKLRVRLQQHQRTVHFLDKAGTQFSM